MWVKAIGVEQSECTLGVPGDYIKPSIILTIAANPFLPNIQSHPRRKSGHG
jgi:hypothetical protein